MGFILIYRVSQKHENSVTNSISSFLWISIVIPNFKSHNIIISAGVYFIKRVNDCKDVSIMLPQDEQWRLTSSLCLYTVIFCLLHTHICSQNINKQTVSIAHKKLMDYSFLSRCYYTKSKNYLKRRYQICYWIPMFLGHPVRKYLEDQKSSRV